MILGARYTARTTDGHYIYIRAHGLYRPGPGNAKQVEADPEKPPQHTVTQDDVEFFSHLRLEAGAGLFNYLNGLVCLGIMTCEGEKLWIDAYHLTNLPGVKPEDVMLND